MKIDSESQLFLLLVWLITACVFLAALYLLREAKQMAATAKEKTSAPYVIPREADKPMPNKWGFTVPPPPNY